MELVSWWLVETLTLYQNEWWIWILSELYKLIELVYFKQMLVQIYDIPVWYLIYMYSYLNVLASIMYSVVDISFSFHRLKSVVFNEPTRIILWKQCTYIIWLIKLSIIAHYPVNWRICYVSSFLSTNISLVYLCNAWHIAKWHFINVNND